MQSSKWCQGTERPIESYLPEDIAKLLDSKDDVEETSDSQLDSLDIFNPTKTTQTQSRRNLASVPNTTVLRTPANADDATRCGVRKSTELETRRRDWSLDGPLWTRSSPGLCDPFQTSVVNFYPLPVARKEVSDVSPKMLKFVMPSGPRQSGEGTEEEIQGILDTLMISANSLVVQMTLLVAGFIIGPSGSSIRSIISRSDATIYSNTEIINGKESRVFYLEGTSRQILHAMEIMTEAVKRYKELAEGNYNGFQVDKKQHIKGVDFYYYPPPRRAVPYAATLRVHKSSKKKTQIQYRSLTRN